MPPKIIFGSKIIQVSQIYWRTRYSTDQTSRKTPEMYRILKRRPVKSYTLAFLQIEHVTSSMPSKIIHICARQMFDRFGGQMLLLCASEGKSLLR